MSLGLQKSVVIYGATGRLGGELLALLQGSEGSRLNLNLAGALGRGDSLDDPKVIALLEVADAVIDVSLPEATRALMNRLSELEEPPALICGVTGLSAKDLSRLATFATRAPTFYARNFSVGVALLTHLSALSARVLGDGFDVELFELHHRQKVDAPSGTAFHLAGAITQTRGGSHSGAPCEHPRDPRLVHMSAGRGGQVIGDHTVYFLGEAERVELTHRAQSRALFAQGALRATRWLLERPGERSGHVLGMSEMISALLDASSPASGAGPAERG